MSDVCTNVSPNEAAITVSYWLNSTNVVHDTIDGEVLAIRSDTGCYYSMVGPSATAWCALTGGSDPEAAAHAVAEHHLADITVVSAELAVFADALVDESLLVPGAARALTAAIELPPETAGQAWTTPTFEKYTDMQDLLLFDPIHEVDTSGWPVVTRHRDT